MQRTHIISILKGLRKKKYIYNCIIKSTFSLILRIEISTKMGHDHLHYCPKARPVLALN